MSTNCSSVFAKTIPALCMIFLTTGGSAAGSCEVSLATHSVCEEANRFALEIMMSRHVTAASVVQDVATGAVVVAVASSPDSLDVGTEVLPLSVVKVFLAASWWDNVTGSTADVSEILITGSDSAGRRLAATLRKRVGAAKVISDLERYGFARDSEESAFDVAPEWAAKLHSPPAKLDLADSGDDDWNSALSIGESRMTMSTIQVSRFLQAIGNGGVRCAVSARHATSGAATHPYEGCKSPVRIIRAETSRQIIAAMTEAVQRGSARTIAEALSKTGWTIGGKTGTGGRPGKPLSEQDGWFAGLILDRRGTPRFTVATFVSGGGLGAGHAAQISAEIGKLLIASTR